MELSMATAAAGIAGTVVRHGAVALDQFAECCVIAVESAILAIPLDKR